MQHRFARPLLIGIVGAGAVAFTPAAASAHGITGATGPSYNYIWSGFTHMITGWDHLLFIAGILFLARTIKLSAKLISLFALGHSTTLIAATMAGWRLNPVGVDVIIAASLVFVGLVGWFGPPTRWRWFGAAVLGFGLVHGLGLATRLQDLGLPHEPLRVLARVLAFNVGVEVGQLVAIVLMFMAGDVISRYLTWAHTRKAVNGALAGVGLVTALLLSFGVIGVKPAPVQAAGLGTCQVRDRTETYPGSANGNHPAKDFYEPAETTPTKDFGHVLGDGMVLVHYRPDLTGEQLTTLRTYVTGPDGRGVLAGPAPDQTDLFKVVNAYQTMVCNDFDLEPMRTFAKAWFADPRSGSN